jgi:hypothetical protein
MKHLRTLSAWSDDHPIYSMAIGWLVLVVVVLTFVPADSNFHPQHTHRSAT